MTEQLTPEQQAAIEALRERVAPSVPAEPQASTVDWTTFVLPEQYEHFYPKAKRIQTEQGEKWGAPYQEFWGENAPFNKGKLETFLEAHINGPNGWNLVAIVPNGSGLSHVVFRRNTTLILPDPAPIDVAPEVGQPTGVDLTKLEEVSKAWASDNGPEVA